MFSEFFQQLDLTKSIHFRSCSKYEQMVLQVLSSEFHRTGVEESSVGAVFRFGFHQPGSF